MVFMTVLKRSIKDMPAEMFRMETFAPGMTVFGLSFIMLFLGMLVMNDRNSSFLPRLYSSPMTAADYIVGYIVPMIPIGVLQTAVCLAVAAVLGLEVSINWLGFAAVLIPVILMFASLGLLLGVIFSTPAINGIGTVIINLSALLSGTWFSLELVGEGFRTFCYCLPFAHSVDAATKALAGDYSEIAVNLLVVLGYTAVFLILGSVLFKKKMKN